MTLLFKKTQFDKHRARFAGLTLDEYRAGKTYGAFKKFQLRLLKHRRDSLKLQQELEKRASRTED